MWIKKNTFAIGGLREMGFKPGSDLLMVLSGQGRGIFNCETGEKINRDRSDYYMEFWNSENGKVDGFGLLTGESIICGGFEYENPLSEKTSDGWEVKIELKISKDWRLKSKKAKIMYLVHEKSKILIDTFFFGIDRAYGFSDTGNSFVCSSSSELHIWTRKNS